MFGIVIGMQIYMQNEYQDVIKSEEHIGINTYEILST